ncbi:MAG: polyphosphate kinase 1 [Alkalibacterium sp.]|nr:polyphosphate kinase 1 [Alkalibacterium sp.]
MGMVKDTLNIEDPMYYQNRELSWLDFNARVVEEANDPDNPLLEQLRYLAIGSSNLDEFYKVRVAGLQDQLKMGVIEPDTKKQWPAKKQLQEINKKNRKNVQRQYELFEHKKVQLSEAGVFFKSVKELNEQDTTKARLLFEKDILPAITPYGIDAYRPFHQLSDGLLHLFVKLEKNGAPYVAIVPIPERLDRVHPIYTKEQTYLLMIEDLLGSFLSELFKGYQITYSFTFRITRNADLELQEEDAEDLLSVIEDYLEKRKNGMAVRLEIDQRDAPVNVQNDVDFIKKALSIKRYDVYLLDGPIDLTFLNDTISLLERNGLNETYQPFTPYLPAIYDKQSIYALARQKDLFFHHPYDSFEPIIQFVKEATDDPQTVSIKQTLYRVSKDSPLIEALKQAAKAGIQVTVLLELKARFDEANNVHWAKELEEAGVHILYGMKGLKIHSKATLIVKKEKDGFRRYVHMGTGNYNEQTAKLYTDMGLITSNNEMTQDVFNFFNYLSGYSDQPAYHYLHVSPFDIRDAFIENIEKEIDMHKRFGNGHIIAKMNSLTDKKMLLKLYEASQSGVKIDLIVRGICCLIPGIPGVSENITVRSVIGRFLEHSRVYYFYHNGEENLYLSSADMMTRNMIKRVEIAFPILDTSLKSHILSILRLYLYDNRKAWILTSDGLYTKSFPEEKSIHAQNELLEINHTLSPPLSNQTPKQTWVDFIKNVVFNR